VINPRGFLVLAIWAAFLILLYIAPVRAAGEPQPETFRYTCEDIRRAVALFPSVWAAEKAARAAGASDRQIVEARKCLSR
jgi:hypothetical protein